MGKDFFKNDATLKQLGVEYQKLIALEKCLNASENENIYIECLGDVADDEESMEIKHHVGNHNLISNSEDFWKTLKNYVEEFSIINTFSKLTLFTTSKIPSTSIFFEWEKKSVKEMLNVIKDHTPSETAKPFYEKVANAEKVELESILSKFEIMSNQPKIKDKWEELKQNNTLTIVSNKHLDDALFWLHGYISKKAFDDGKKWEININDFKRDLRDSLSKYATPDIIFHKADKDDIDPESSSKFEFIESLKKISVKKTAIENAISDYMRTQISKVAMLQASPTLEDSLEEYEDDVERNINEHKEQKAIDLSPKDLKTKKANKTSYKLYYDCITQKHNEIQNVKGTERYYRNGCIHSVVESKRFDWEYKEEDL